MCFAILIGTCSCRAIITEDKSIKIVGVTKDDEGVYICEADNAVGRIAGMATLAIHCMLFVYICFCLCVLHFVFK